MPPIDQYKWELYHIADDYSESKDLASTMPDKLKEMQALFQKEAADHQVLPLDNSGFVRALTARPSAIAGKTVFTYTGENANIPDGNAPNVLGKNFTITAEVTIPSGGAEGVVVTEGGMIGGYGLYLSQSNNWWLRSTVLKVVVWGLLLLGLLLSWIARTRRWTGWKTWPAYALILLAPLWLVAGLITGAAQIGKGRPIFVYNMLDLERFRWSGPSLSAGKHTIIFDFKYDGPGVGKGGTGVLTVDGKEVDRKTMEHTIPFLMPADESFDVGLDTRTPVDFAYDCPFRFTGTIDKLTYNLGPSQLSAEDQRKVQDAVAKVND
jgi:arylsulfatase